MKGYYLDPHPNANVAAEHFAVVKMPGRNRKRFPETSVTIVADKETALERARDDNILYAARVMGPARSSEGCNIFYLMDLFEDSL